MRRAGLGSTDLSRVGELAVEKGIESKLFRTLVRGVHSTRVGIGDAEVRTVSGMLVPSTVSKRIRSRPRCPLAIELPDRTPAGAIRVLAPVAK